jgi:hypothetical protein
MKPLINLRHIEVWRREAERGLSDINSHAYNWTDGWFAGESFPDQATTERIMKTYFQGKSLFEQLTGLRAVCQDILNGKLPEMEAEFKKNCDPESFDPFAKVAIFFENEFDAGALPPTIQQYTQLLEIMVGYTERKQRGMQNIENLIVGVRNSCEDDFERLMWQQKEDNDFTMIPHLNPFDMERRLDDAQVEFALDKYDEFYARCQEMIETHQKTGNIHDCALDIFLLFANDGTPALNTLTIQTPA